ncbi:MAG: hypothetical protein JNM84_12515 [Planctomycetes bacterium]|nr:hypothetical protein [Planctomycetota bacterium]
MRPRVPSNPHRRMLPPTVARSTRAALLAGSVLLASCSSSRYAVPPGAERDRIYCCLGEITRLEIAADGTFSLDLRPDAEGQRYLAPQQTVLVCELDRPEHAGNFRPVWDMLHVGSRAKVCGYWITDTEREGQHLFLPVTALSPIVEEAGTTPAPSIK